ncbi:hypothetical protein BH11ARM2_BH11ARM2_07260 [soil metagenome]
MPLVDYMLLIYCDEDTMATEIDARATTGIDQPCENLVKGLQAKGKHIASDRLHPVATATSVRVRDGQRLVTDGPFAETREQLAGYMLVKAENLDEAIRIAEQHPVAGYGTIEVRPVMNYPFGME